MLVLVNYKVRFDMKTALGRLKSLYCAGLQLVCRKHTAFGHVMPPMRDATKSQHVLLLSTKTTAN